MAPDMVIICDDCSTPILEIRDGVIIVRSRHHGVKHVTTVPVSAILDKRAEVVVNK